MESVVAALSTGLLTLAGVLVSNLRSRAVMEVKMTASRGGWRSTTASSNVSTPWSKTSP